MGYVSTCVFQCSRQGDAWSSAWLIDHSETLISHKRIVYLSRRLGWTLARTALISFGIHSLRRRLVYSWSITSLVSWYNSMPQYTNTKKYQLLTTSTVLNENCNTMFTVIPLRNSCNPYTSRLCSVLTIVKLQPAMLPVSAALNSHSRIHANICGRTYD